MTNDETEKINFGVKDRLSWGLRKYSHKNQSIKGTRKINYPAVVPALSGPGSCDPMNNSELKIFASIFLNNLTTFNCDSHWHVISRVEEIYSITNRWRLCWARDREWKPDLLPKEKQHIKAAKGHHEDVGHPGNSTSP